jgi:protoporphyrinogen oxidase/cytochrome b involved in lipid metabolism
MGHLKQKKTKTKLLNLDRNKYRDTTIEIYDIIIIGGGISGLYCAYNLLKKDKNLKVLVLEKNSNLGGRISTFYGGKDDKEVSKDIIFEKGAVRFNDNHKLLNDLLLELDLISKKIKITNVNNTIWIPKNKFSKLRKQYPNMDNIIKELRKQLKSNKVSENEIIKYNLQELVKKYLVPNNKESAKHTNLNLVKYIEEMYPYFAEQYNMNAVDALKIFSQDFKQEIQYYILNGGLSQIITKLELRVINMGGIIKKGYDVRDIKKGQNGLYIINDNLKCQKIISSIPKLDIQKIKYLNVLLGTKILNTIECIPLYRIYAKYPKSTINKENRIWFSGMDKMVINHPLKFILPYDEKNGIIHISYTDGKYAMYLWKKLMNGSINSYLDIEINKIFRHKIKGLKKIPKPEWVKHYYWECGMGCWKKGVSSKDIINKVIKPQEKEEVYYCGENFSNQQAWIEGALFTGNKVLKKILLKDGLKKKIVNVKINGSKKTMKINKGNNNGSKKTMKINKGKYSGEKEYSMKEVKTHNTRKDAWIVINKGVYNITDWIDKHPGGDIIMKGVGKDTTQLFESIGHPEYVKKMLKKMKVGYIV